MTWAAELLGDVDDTGRLALGDLTLEDVEAIAAAGMTEDPGALAALVWRILEELRELREKLGRQDPTRYNHPGAR